VYKAEEKVWDAIETKPFLTRKVQFVCCLNTMGQDRKFTEEQRLFALRTVQRYRDRWEQSERENLKNDIHLKIQRMETSKIYKEYEPLDNAELDMRAEATLSLKDSNEPLTDENKLTHIKRARAILLAKTFYDPEGIIVH